MNQLRAKRILKMGQRVGFTKGIPAFCPSGRQRRSKIFPIFLWEGRFKSQALLDEAALAACMAYVDLNPVRAKIAATPEAWDYTTLQSRILYLKNAISENSTALPAQLLPFVGNPREPIPDVLPFKVDDYLELVDWSGRIVRKGIRGAIAATTLAILQRLGIAVETWERLNRQFASKSALCFGCARLAANNKKVFWA